MNNHSASGRRPSSPPDPRESAAAGLGHYESKPLALRPEAMAPAPAPTTTLDHLPRTGSGPSQSEGTIAGTYRPLMPLSIAPSMSLGMADCPVDFRHLVDEAPVAMLVTQRGRVRYANPAAIRIFGAAGASTLMDRSVTDLVHPDFHDEALERCRRAEEGASPLPVTLQRIRRLDGSDLDVAVACSRTTFGGQPAVQAIVRGIGIDEQSARLAQRQAEAQYRLIFENAAAGIFQTTYGGRVLALNERCARMFGYPSAEAVLEIGLDVNHDVYVDPARRQAILEILDREGEVTEFEAELRRRDGSTFWVMLSCRLVTDAASGLRRIDGLCVDITDRKRAEALLRESEARFRHVYDNAPVMMHIVDERGVILDANRKWLRELGYEREEVIGRRIEEFVHRATKPGGQWRDVPGRYTWFAYLRNVPQQMVRRNGDLIDVLVDSDPTTDPSGRRISLTVLRDVMEQKRAEAALHYRVEYENLIARISTQFINLSSSHIDAGIEEALEQLARFTEVDRATLVLVTPEACTVRRAFQWRRRGVPANPLASPGTLLPSALRPLSAGGTAQPASAMVDLSRISPEVRAASGVLAADDAKSALSVTMSLGGRALGVITLETTEQPRKWQRDQTTLVRIVGEIVTNAVQRQEWERTLRENEERFRRLAESRQVLLRELDHRVKNNLASLMSLINMMESRTRATDEFADAFRSRLQAMSTVHDIIASAEWRTVELGALVTRLAELCDPSPAGRVVRDRLTVDGPPIQVNSRQAGPVAMLLQELVTNSHKHGAARRDSESGAISVTWRVVEDTQENRGLEIVWEEWGEATISSTPNEHGLGIRLIEGFCRFELGGSCEFTFRPEGIRCVMRWNLDRTGST